MDWLDRFRSDYRRQLIRRGLVPQSSDDFQPLVQSSSLKSARQDFQHVRSWIRPNIPEPLHELEAFICDHTQLISPASCPEFFLQLADAITPIWEATEAMLNQQNLPPPFWAFCWPGGQALARYLLDVPQAVAGKSVIDFGSGCGITAIAAARAGAGRVIATDIDAIAVAAIGLNAWHNQVDVEMWLEDIIDMPARISHDHHFDILLLGDMHYESNLAKRMLPWIERLRRDEGVEVLIGDPGRRFLPKVGLESLVDFNISTSPEIENSTQQRSTVYRLGQGLPEAPTQRHRSVQGSHL